MEETLAKKQDAVALVFFTPYRPWLFGKDMSFFDLAREAGFVVEKIFEERMEEVMFKEDHGDEELRRTVFGYTVRWSL
jgi:nicotinamide N-methyltransferase